MLTTEGDFCVLAVRTVKIVTILTLLACWLIFPWPAAAGDAVSLTPGVDRIDISPSVEMIEIPDDSLTLSDISSPDFKGQWTANTHKDICVGHTTSAWWFRFKLTRPKGAPRHGWFIEFTKPGLAEIDLHIPVAKGDSPDGGENWRLRRTGAARPLESRDVRFRTYVLKLPDDFNQNEYFYLRVKTVISLNMNVLAWSSEGLAERTWLDYLGFGLVFGVLMAMLLYNLIIGLFLGDRVYLVYVLYMFAMLLNQLFLYGHAHLLWEMAPETYQTMIWVLLGNAWFWGPLFTRIFLRLPQYAPRLDKVALVVIGAAVVMIFFGLIGWGRATNMISNTLCIITPFLGIAAAVISLRKGYTPRHLLSDRLEPDHGGHGRLFPWRRAGGAVLDNDLRPGGSRARGSNPAFPGPGRSYPGAAQGKGGSGKTRAPADGAFHPRRPDRPL